jgi:hypothetical protein
MKKKNKIYPDVTQTTSTRYLKKTGSNEWFDRRSGQLFYKQKGRLMIKIDEQERKAHRQLMDKLRREEKKSGLSTKAERETEAKLWKEYTNSVRDFNKGKKKRASTVARRRKALESKQSEQYTYWHQPPEKLRKMQQDKKKVMIMRISGKHNVKNAEYYNDLIRLLSEYSKLPPAEVESLIFPKALEEATKYEAIKEVLDNGYYSFLDALENQYKKGLISQADMIQAEQLADLGIKRLNNYD